MIAHHSIATAALLLFFFAACQTQSDQPSSQPSDVEVTNEGNTEVAEPTESNETHETIENPADDTAISESDSHEPCSAEWYSWIDEEITSGDGAGHGPDPGSLEWKSTIAFRLGLRGKADVPTPDSDDWCNYIDQLVRSEKE